MKKNHFLIFLFFLIYVNTSIAQVNCKLDSIRNVFIGAGCTELTGCLTGCSIYFYNPQSLSGDAAQAFAQKYGANLISIQDATENACIVQDLNKNGFGGTIWIGFGDSKTEGTFLWYDQSPVTYTNWNTSEPNNAGDEDCVQIFSNGKWNDLSCVSGGSRSIIEVNLCPKTTISANNSTICNGDSAKLVLNTILGAFPYIYSWFSNPAGFTSNLTNPVVKPTVTTTYYAISVDRYGCLSGDSIKINIKAASAATISSNKPTTICLGDSVLLTASTGTSYLWSSGQVSASITVKTSGNYSVVVTDAKGCKASSVTTTVTVNNPPLSDFTTLTGCSNTETKFTDKSTSSNGSITLWAWDFGDGSIFNSTQNPAHTYLNGGTYNVILLVQNTAGCTDTVKKSIQIYPTPNVNFNYTTVCKGKPTLFTDISPTTTGAIKNWNWNFGDGKTDTIKTPSHLYTAAGNYTTILTITTVNGCENKLIKSITVNELPAANFTKNSTCEGGTTLFKDASTIASNNIQSWLWHFGDGSPVNNTQHPSHVYATPDSFKVSLLVTSALGCSDSVIKTIKINPNPVAKFTTTDTIGCKKLCVNFKDESIILANKIVKWRWDFGDATVKSDLKNPIHCYSNNSSLQTTLFNVTLMVTSDSGCTASVTKNNLIKVNPNPKAAFSADPQMAYLLNPVITFTNLSIGGSSWSWYFGDSTTSTLQHPLQHAYNDTGTYVVTFITTTLSNCADTIYQTVIIEPDFSFYIPSSFTPNDDGLNDTFSGKGIFNSHYKMVIYNRWGEVVYTTNDFKKPWDGTTKGGKQMASDNIYVYHISLKDTHRKMHLYRGIVTLIK